MLLLMAISVAVVAAILLLQPKLYLSEATALRASSYTTDKASVFNRNIEALYSTLGSADDLDMIIGTAPRPATSRTTSIGRHDRSGSRP